MNPFARPVAASLAALTCAFLLAGTQSPPPAAPTPAAPPSAAPAPRPNFVFVQAEAQGWSSTSVDMDGAPPSHAKPAGLTPNLEKLAADGTRMSDFYVSAPRCTPTSAAA